MANRNYPQSRQWSNHMMPVSIDMQIAIGASGAPTIAAGNAYGVASITRMAAGQYRLQLQDNYSKLLQFKAAAQSPVGSPVAVTGITPGLVYRIITLGTTTQAQWVTAGVPSGITAAVGVTFLAAATSLGTGTAGLLGSSGVSSVELMSTNPNMLNNSPAGGPQPLLGGYIDFQTMGTVITMGAFTPAGTNSAATFTGAALGTHTHNIAVAAGTAGDAVTNNAGVLNSTGGQDLTTDPTSAGTPAGTVSAAIFTGTPGTPTGTATMAAADPANGSQLLIEVVVSNSSVQ